LQRENARNQEQRVQHKDDESHPLPAGRSQALGGSAAGEACAAAAPGGPGPGGEGSPAGGGCRQHLCRTTAQVRSERCIIAARCLKGWWQTSHVSHCCGACTGSQPASICQHQRADVHCHDRYIRTAADDSLALQSLTYILAGLPAGTGSSRRSRQRSSVPLNASSCHRQSSATRLAHLPSCRAAMHSSSTSSRATTATQTPKLAYQQQQQQGALRLRLTARASQHHSSRPRYQHLLRCLLHGAPCPSRCHPSSSHSSTLCLGS
jgi:hypothetical protein